MLCNQIGYQSTVPFTGIVTGMVTPPKRARRRLYLKEHREAVGMSAAKMGEKLGIERESVYRLEREPWRMDPEKQADYAHALGIEPEELWRPPGTPYLDGILRGADDSLKATAADIVKRLVERK